MPDRSEFTVSKWPQKLLAIINKKLSVLSEISDVIAVNQVEKNGVSGEKKYTTVSILLTF